MSLVTSSSGENPLPFSATKSKRRVSFQSGKFPSHVAVDLDQTYSYSPIQPSLTNLTST